MRLGRQQRLLVHPLDKAARVSHCQAIIVHQKPHRSHRGVIPVTECVHHRLAECLAVKIRNLGPHQATHHLMAWIPRLQQRVDPIEHINQWQRERVDVHARHCARHHLEHRRGRRQGTPDGVDGPDGQQSRHGRAGALRTVNHQVQSLVEVLVIESQQRITGIGLPDVRPQPVSGLRIQIGQRRFGSRLVAVVIAALLREAADELGHEQGHHLRRTVGLKTSLQRSAFAGRYDLATIAHLNAHHRQAMLMHQLDPRRNLRDRAVEDECRQTIDIAMAVTDASYRTIVLNAEVQRAAFGIGQRDHIIHNLRIGLRPCDFAFEFHAQRFPIRYHHSPLTCSLSIILTC